MPSDNIETSQVWLDISSQLIKAKQENKKAVQDLPPADQMIRLTQDTGHLKLLIYGLAIALLAVATAGWNMFLHMDNKIEHKIDYINAKLDFIITGQK